jgi:3-hydroxyisobutyrate dehydrogenase
MKEQLERPVGCVGLGHMGHVMATNLVAAGFPVLGYDVAGEGRLPGGASWRPSAGDVARDVGVMILSLPDGGASTAVATEIAAHHISGGPLRCVVDTSTIGMQAARRAAETLRSGGLAYLDAPVSGGVAGATGRTMAVMCSGDRQVFADVEDVLAALSKNVYYVGSEPGMGQALKIANNFLSATALVATSEAIRFGESVGLDVRDMLTVFNASSGRNTATADKFVNQIVTGKYASGFSNTLMAKDLSLYVGEVDREAGVCRLGDATAAVWKEFAQADPGADFTRIYEFIGELERRGST